MSRRWVRPKGGFPDIREEEEGNREAEGCREEPRWTKEEVTRLVALTTGCAIG
jgi:hypothetical protein